MTQPRNEIAAMFDQVWDDADFRFDIKAQEVATDLARALHESGTSLAELCEKLGWQPSRVSKVLGGGANLTLKTLQQLSGALGLEFDVILRGPGQARAARPGKAAIWNTTSAGCMTKYSITIPSSIICWRPPANSTAMPGSAPRTSIA